jgi:hypothetical protein
MYSNLKITIITILLLAGGCATTTQQPIIATPETSSRDMRIQTEEELILADREISRQEAEAKEEETYSASLDKINETFNREYQQYQSCLVVAEKLTMCFEQLKETCSIDMILDSRMGHHLKPYCAKQFLDSQKPSKTHN